MKKAAAAIRRFFQNISLQHKILLSCMVLVLLSSSAIGLYSILTLRSFTLRQSEMSVEQVIGEISGTMSRKLTQIKNVANVIASNEAMISALENTDSTAWERYEMYKNVIDPVFSSIRSIYGDIASIVIYQDNPVLVRHSAEIREFSEIAREKWKDEVMDFSQQWRTDQQQLCLNMRLPGLYANAPVLLMEIRMDHSRIFNFSFDLFDEYALIITDQKGNTLWERNLLSRDSAGIGSPEALASGEYHIWQMAIQGLDGQMQVIVPSRLLMVSTRRFVQSMLFTLLLCILSVCVIAVCLSRSIVRRIRLLNASMNQVAKGDLSIRLENEAEDEIGALTDKFNEMIAALQQSMINLAETEKKEKEAEMRALRAQINPHFLYNTLSLISWKAMELHADQVAHIARIFSRFCRTVLNRGMTESYLMDEITNVNCYVEIQREMHDNSFDISYAIPDVFQQCLVPTFILQPLVENAIRHGIERLRGLYGMLKIEATESGGDLICMVYNNGLPFEEEVLKKALSSKEKGYGLRNVQERVQYLWGEKYGLFLGTPTKEFTTCVGLRLKLIYASEARPKHTEIASE